MAINKFKYIILSILPAVLSAGCTDEFFGPDENHVGSDPDVITFSAVAGGASVRTRAAGEKKLYEPLELTDESSSATLYLHTYDAEKIGYQPGEDAVEENGADGVQTRGMQIKTAEDLIKFHADFMVHAEYQDSHEEYIEWCRTKVSSANNFWRTADTRYWPGERMLDFHAVSPSSEYSSLGTVNQTGNSISFSYTAKKGSENKDAEAQTDLLMASGSCNKKTSDNGRAPLLFHHALSAVKFAVRDVVDGEVVNIKIKNVHSAGNCIYTADGTGAGNFTWSDVGSSKKETYSQDFNYKINGRPAVSPNDESKDFVMNNEMPAKTFMLIPQQIPEDAEIEVTLKRTKPGVAQEITVRGKIRANNVTEWKPGHEYIYTISTSKDNWVYVFNVNGSYRNNTEIYMPCPADEEIYKTYTDGGGANRPYFEVVSYRYHANDQSMTENLPWTASHGTGHQYYYTHYYETFAEKDAVLYLDRPRNKSVREDIPANEWIKDLSTNRFKGNGSVNSERHNLSFLEPIVTTDWHGDENMYKNDPYSGNSESNPWDLSTFGGHTSRNTANCYIIDREGWYAIPLYYGNAIKNGAVNAGAWKVDGTVCPDRDKKNGSVTFRYKGLLEFQDHKGTPITNNTGKIPDSYYNSAHLLWQDTYNLVENVKLVTVNGEKMIVFHVNKDNIQQGNALIGLSEAAENSFNANSPKIVWSWHIWFNEHWLNNAGVSNAFSSTGFDTSLNSVSQMQQQGDVEVTVLKSGSNTQNFWVAPYNIGWCDAKNVRYLSRYNTMDFVQYEKDGTKESGRTAKLPIIQDGKTIQYRIGNNVYFQFGRKDPFVGFINNNSILKPNFGELKYTLKPQLRSISYAIQNPHELFVGAEATENGGTATANNEWNGESGWVNSKTQLTEFYNLWNNTSYNKTNSNAGVMTNNEYFTSKKTVYDPSPAGYVVPPAGFFKILFKVEPSTVSYQKRVVDNKGNVSYPTKFASYNQTESCVSEANLTNVLNGVKIDRSSGHPLYRIYTKRGNTSQFFSLTGTGHRWYANSLVGAGNNFNPHIVYLWSSNVTKTIQDRSGYTIALGEDGMMWDSKNEKEVTGYIVSTAFNGRKSMARPIRCVRE